MICLTGKLFKGRSFKIQSQLIIEIEDSFLNYRALSMTSHLWPWEVPKRLLPCKLRQEKEQLLTWLWSPASRRRPRWANLSNSALNLIILIKPRNWHFWWEITLVSKCLSKSLREREEWELSFLKQECCGPWLTLITLWETRNGAY